MSSGTQQGFYLVTHNIINLYGDQTAFQSEEVSATELMQFSKQVLAQNNCLF
jgi:hypothetical protein